MNKPETTETINEETVNNESEETSLDLTITPLRKTIRTTVRTGAAKSPDDCSRRWAE